MYLRDSKTFGGKGRWTIYFYFVFQLLAGNNNPYSEKEQVFDPAIVATKVRFIPYTSHMRMVCIRVELYGCPWTGEYNLLQLLSPPISQGLATYLWQGIHR